ncbi:hydrogen peroxide-inducible genes activator [Phaeobacter sp.]|uniref:hydrogen peroxide-inducible genes activator n=1 Tax=Phaeobacter sp. TaxID=1902409 RepID=UPI0025F0DA6F|nr:hydrogen peroxide-inducible genes activator [Phaeobacter sp.]
MADITLRQLRYFAVLSRALQYRTAARQLGISQPSLSLQIAALETHLGAPLVERRRSGLILTAVGRETAQRAEEILRSVDALGQLAGSAQEQLVGTLRLGSSPTIGPYLLPRVLRGLPAAFPDVKLIIRDGPPRMLTEDLMAGQHDLILTQLPVPRDDIRHEFLFREPLLLAVSQRHPLAGQAKISRTALEGESMLGLNASYSLGRQTSDLAAASGAMLRQDLEGTSLDALRQMVSLDMGVTVLPALYVESEVRGGGGDVDVLALRPEPYRHVGLAWRSSSGNPASYQRLASYIREVLAREFAGTIRL